MDEQTYPVFKITFLPFSGNSLSTFKQQLNQRISLFARDQNLDKYVENTEPSSSMENLLTELEKTEKRIVILIDEYDCQMTANINNKELYDSYKTVIHDFYGAIKDKKAVKFMFVT